MISNIMNGVLLHADANESVHNVTRLLVSNNADAVLVRENGMPKGLITGDHILKSLITNRDPKDILAREIMHNPIIAINHDDDINKVRLLMLETGMTKIPVKKDLDIIGLFVETDFIRELSWRQ